MFVSHISQPRLSPQFAAPMLPPVIGHRGAAARAPENTLAGLRVARQIGCEWVEFDARLSGDGAVVLCHDARLDRTTDGSGPVSAQTLAAIRDRDAGCRFGAEFAGERVPTLEDALMLAVELGLGVNIEVKAEHGRHYATAAAIAATLTRLHGQLPPLIVSSFEPSVLLAFRALRPQTPLGVLFRTVPRHWLELASRSGCAVIGADHRRLRRRQVAGIRDAGYPLAAYTVNDPARARLLYEWGVTSVFSDAPDIILKGRVGHRPARPARGIPRRPARAGPRMGQGANG